MKITIYNYEAFHVKLNITHKDPESTKQVILNKGEQTTIKDPDQLTMQAILDPESSPGQPLQWYVNFDGSSKKMTVCSLENPYVYPSFLSLIPLIIGDIKMKPSGGIFNIGDSTEVPVVFGKKES